MSYKYIKPFFIFAFLAFISCGLFAENINNPILIRPNLSDKTKSDIYLKDQTGKQTFFVTLTDVHKNHYHNSEFHNGNVYIIQRTGGDFGYTKNPDWTDELWRYAPHKSGKKLYSIQGLDFRVSDDEKFIVIAQGTTISILDHDGHVIKTIPANDFDNIGYLAWSNHTLWVGYGATTQIKALTKINADTSQINTFDVTKLNINSEEFSLNPTLEKIAFSDYPPIFDVDTQQEFNKSQKPVHLFVYDLKTGNKQIVAVSKAKKFHPKWNNNILTFDNPNGTGKTQWRAR